MNALPSAPARVMLRAIELYQRAAEGRPSPCRFTPSCSEYAREAVEAYGAGRGGWLAVRRLSRCRPFGKSGYDPVPERCASDHARPAEPFSPSSTHQSKVT